MAKTSIAYIVCNIIITLNMAEFPLKFYSGFGWKLLNQMKNTTVIITILPI